MAFIFFPLKHDQVPAFAFGYSLLKTRSDKQVAATLLVTAVSNGLAVITCSSTSKASRTDLANKLTVKFL